MLDALKEEVCALHQELARYRLVAWSSGNLSARDAKSGLVVIKPSGVRYEHLTPEKMVVVDLDGEVIEGRLAPSVDCASHLYIYRQREEIGGVVHTHSPYATAFAAVGKSIPIALTAMADQFGGRIPCSDYAAVGGEAIGREVLATEEGGGAVLLKSHGVFTLAVSAEEATKSAVFVEECAKTLLFASTLAPLEELPEEEVRRAHNRYVDCYGQQPLVTL